VISLIWMAYGSGLRFVLDQKNNVITKVYGAPPLSFDEGL